MTDYNNKIKRIIISEAEINEKVKSLGEELSNEYKDKPLLFVSILNGGFTFLADVIRAVNIPCEIAFMRVKSYFGNTVSSGNVEIVMDIDRDISSYHIVILEDIIDTGRTLKQIVEILKNRNPLSLKVVTLLDKPDRRVVDFVPDKALFTIPDLFVIGYGMDFDEKFRNLPYIAEYNI